jgi:hypothetical protein
VRLKDKVVFNRGNFLIDIINMAADAVGYVFYMKPPDRFDEDHLEANYNLSTGIGVFRQNQAMHAHPREHIELIHEAQTLTGVSAKFTDQPLAYNIRVRGKHVKNQRRGGRQLAGRDDRSYRYMYIYRPPWSRDPGVKAIGGADAPNMPSQQWRNGGIKKYVVWHDDQLRSVRACLVAALFIAFREALESAQATLAAPAMPSIGLDNQCALFDVGTGLSTRMWVATRTLSFSTGEDAAFTMNLGGSLIDLPDIAAVRYELNRTLDDSNYRPGLSFNERTGTYAPIYRHTDGNDRHPDKLWVPG